MNVVVIKYNAGNIQSVLFALQRIGVQATVSNDPEKILSADKIIFPGVGEASSAMQYLKQRKLDEVICSARQPVLGICLGMQLLCKYSEENDTNCIGIFSDVTVKKFIHRGNDLKIPQIGWNTITGLQTGLFDSVENNSYCYFVHGYYAELSNYTIARAEYGNSYSAALNKNNFYGVQFHPEKSAATGEIILKNFLSL
jgi:imidazole glycerol-phosphate synthase subunit HisH